MNNLLKIGIFSTSSPIKRKPSKKDYAYLKSKGFDIFEHPQVRLQTGHTAGTVEERVNALHSMIQDKSIDILMAFWGGANTNQLLPHVNYELFKKYPKPIVGFSDTSALLLAVNKIAGIKTYMGPSAITFTKPEPFEYTFDYFKKVVIDQEEVVINDSPEFADDLYFLRKDSDHRIIQKNPGRKVFKHGRAKGEVVASNLQTLLVLAGTKHFPDLKGKVLFLEEAEEETTDMIHRYFTHLSQVIDLETLKAICIGRFCSQSGFTKNDSEEMMYEDVFKDVNIPIIYNLDFGHSDPLFTIPLGARATIDTSKNILRFSLH